MSTFLPTDLANSKYGLDVMSDFEVFHNFSTDVARKAFLANDPTRARRLGFEQIETLKSNASKLRRFLSNQRR
jgi:hypothetical protein